VDKGARSDDDNVVRINRPEAQYSLGRSIEKHGRWERIHDTIQRQPTIKERHRPRGINHDTPSKKHNKELTKVTLATTDREVRTRVVISVCRGARGKNKPGKKMARRGRSSHNNSEK